jgi:hypothetical protein
MNSSDCWLTSVIFFKSLSAPLCTICLVYVASHEEESIDSNMVVFPFHRTFSSTLLRDVFHRQLCAQWDVQNGAPLFQSGSNPMQSELENHKLTTHRGADTCGITLLPFFVVVVNNTRLGLIEIINNLVVTIGMK